MKRCLYLTGLSLSIIFNAFAQNSASVPLQTDTTEKSKTSLNLAAIYASDASYYGQTTGDRLPYALINASVSFPTGFFLSAGAYKLLNVGAGVSGIDLSAGFDFKLSKNLSSSLSYTRSFFPDSSLLLQSTNLNMASASLKYDWKFIETDLNADYAIGNQNALFMTFEASKLIDLGNLSSKNDYISLEPTFELVGGTQFITETEEVPPPNNGGNGGGSLKKLIRLPRSGNRPPQYREVEKAKFDLLSYNFKLPIAYNRANYAIEATYQGSVLSNRIENVSQKPRSFLYLGFYYMFN